MANFYFEPEFDFLQIFSFYSVQANFDFPMVMFRIDDYYLSNPFGKNKRTELK